MVSLYPIPVSYLLTPGLAPSPLRKACADKRERKREGGERERKREREILCEKKAASSPRGEEERRGASVREEIVQWNEK